MLVSDPEVLPKNGADARLGQLQLIPSELSWHPSGPADAANTSPLTLGSRGVC